MEYHKWNTTVPRKPRDWGLGVRFILLSLILTKSLNSGQALNNILDIGVG